MTTDALTGQLTGPVAGPVAQVDPGASQPPAVPGYHPPTAQSSYPQAPATGPAGTQAPMAEPGTGSGGYGSTSYGSTSYGSTGYGNAVPPQAPHYASPTEPQPGAHSYGFAIASFVIGIASIISGWTLIAPIVGLILGIIALRRYTAERTLALWGVWLNGVILAFAALGIVALIALTSFGLFAGTFAFGF